MTSSATYLFSIDLEDIRLLMPDGEQYRESVPRLTQTLLGFLKAHNVTITFFVVGDMARRYPSLIQQIMSERHEIACHTDKHIPLDKLGEDKFRIDLQNNIQALRDAGATNIIGFRAPIFSLTSKTSWAYKVMAECGIKYSSSVLPAESPLYGWKEFGATPRVVDSILELPMTVANLGPLTVPFAGGVYFRAFPGWFLKVLFFAKRHEPILGYLHPYDIDTEQEHFMHPGINESKFFNWLMYYGRSGALHKLSTFLKTHAVYRYDQILDGELARARK